MPLYSHRKLFIVLGLFIQVLIGHAQDSIWRKTEWADIKVDSSSFYTSVLQKTYIEIGSYNEFHKSRPSIKLILDGEPDSLRDFFLLQLKVDTADFVAFENAIKSKHNELNTDRNIGAVGIKIVKDSVEDGFVFSDKAALLDLFKFVSSHFKLSLHSEKVDFHLNQLLSQYDTKLSAPPVPWSLINGSVWISSTEDYTRNMKYISFTCPKVADTSYFQGDYRFGIDSVEFINLSNLLSVTECNSKKYMLRDPFIFSIKSGSQQRAFKLDYRECIRAVLEKIPAIFQQEDKRKKVQEAVNYFISAYKLNYY